MNHLKPLKWGEYTWLYGIPILLNFFACSLVIPYLKTTTSLPIEIIYFISVGGIVLAPMFFGAIFLSFDETGTKSVRALFQRMRIHRLSASDWIWTISTFLVLCVASFVIAKVLMPAFGLDATPFFFQNMPLDHENMWILYVWPLFFFFNIFGEEFLWRGYILPRQEIFHKRWAWLFNGIFWAVWHIPMGFDLILASLPIFFILPAVVQLRQNTTIAIVVHAIFGAFGFLAIALGAVH